jgi:hypothetical protein
MFFAMLDGWQLLRVMIALGTVAGAMMLVLFVVILLTKGRRAFRSKGDERGKQ